MFIRLGVFVVAILTALPSSAAICRWKDASGRTQYSDNPPPGVSCEGTVKPPKPAANPAPAPAAGAAAGGGAPAAAPGKPTAQDAEMAFRKRRQEKLDAEAKQKQEKQLAEQKKALCDEARNRVAGLQRGGRVAKYDASGQLVYVGDDEIPKELESARRAEAEACK